MSNTDVFPFLVFLSSFKRASFVGENQFIVEVGRGILRPKRELVGFEECEIAQVCLGCGQHLFVNRLERRLRRIMDNGGVLLVNLAKGRVGEDAATLLGGVLVSTLGLAALSRAEMDPASRRPFFIYVDEFQTFTTQSFVSMLPDLRKHGAGLILANQYLNQLEAPIRHAVLGNAGTLISFRSGPDDARVLAAEFQPVFGVEDLLNLPNRDFYLRLMIEGAPSKPFSAKTILSDLGNDPARFWEEGSLGMPARALGTLDARCVVHEEL